MASPETTSNAIIIAPAAANAISVTPSATAWANSAYSQLIAANTEANAIVLLGVTVANGSGSEFEVDISSGASGSEVVIGTLRGNALSAASLSPGILWFPIALDNIAANVRVAVRMRQSGTSTVAWTFALLYYRKPVGGQVTVTANASLVVPSAAGGASVTPSGTAWANSAYSQLIASTGSAIILAAVIFNPAVAVEFEGDVATGAAGSEVVVTTVRGSLLGAVSGGICVLSLRTPLDNIAATTRVAVRLRKAGVSTAAWDFALLYYNKPL